MRFQTPQTTKLQTAKSEASMSHHDRYQHDDYPTPATSAEEFPI
jgi:hypothetical protein